MSFYAGIPGTKIAVFHFNDAPAQPARAEQTDADPSLLTGIVAILSLNVVYANLDFTRLLMETINGIYSGNTRTISD